MHRGTIGFGVASFALLALAPTACGARTALGILGAGAIEGGPTDGEVAQGPCAFGPVVADIFGQVIYFGGGASVPQGRYRVRYVDGCMKYSGVEDWAVHAYGVGSTAGNDAFWLVGATTNDKIAMPPGTVGFLVGSGGFETFEACVAANLGLAPLDIDFAGGPIGVWLEDDPYADNVPGPNGRNPTWALTPIGSCDGG